MPRRLHTTCREYLESRPTGALTIPNVLLTTSYLFPTIALLVTQHFPDNNSEFTDVRRTGDVSRTVVLLRNDRFFPLPYIPHLRNYFYLSLQCIGVDSVHGRLAKDFSAFPRWLGIVAPSRQHAGSNYISQRNIQHTTILYNDR